MFLPHTTIKHLTADDPREPNIKYWICDYHLSLEASLGLNSLGNSLDDCDSFINDDEEDSTKGDTNEYGQGYHTEF